MTLSVIKVGLSFIGCRVNSLLNEAVLILTVFPDITEVHSKEAHTPVNHSPIKVQPVQCNDLFKAILNTGYSALQRFYFHCIGSGKPDAVYMFACGCSDFYYETYLKPAYFEPYLSMTTNYKTDNKPIIKPTNLCSQNYTREPKHSTSKGFFG